MTKTQLKKEMKNRIVALSKELFKELAKWDRAELETAEEVINEYTATNCGWIEFNLSPGLRNLFRCRLTEITPSSQQKVTNQ